VPLTAATPTHARVQMVTRVLTVRLLLVRARTSHAPMAAPALCRELRFNASVYRAILDQTARHVSSFKFTEYLLNQS